MNELKNFNNLNLEDLENINGGSACDWGVGLSGVALSTLYGAAFGTAFGGPAGAIAGAIVGAACPK